MTLPHQFPPNSNLQPCQASLLQAKRLHVSQHHVLAAGPPTLGDSALHQANEWASRATMAQCTPPVSVAGPPASASGAEPEPPAQGAAAPCFQHAHADSKKGRGAQQDQTGQRSAPSCCSLNVCHSLYETLLGVQFHWLIRFRRGTPPLGELHGGCTEGRVEIFLHLSVRSFIY